MQQDGNSVLNGNTTSAVDLSVLICTYNRARDLRDVLETVASQETQGFFSFELVVVDNCSTDDTRQVVESFIAEGRVDTRYIYESRAGKSNALNTGLAHIKGRFFSIVDDDFVLPPFWLRSLYAAFQKYPSAAFVGGKVLPLWENVPPSWLTRSHWSAIAMADHGDEEFYTDKDKPVCLLACSFRTEDVKAVGGYLPELGVRGSQIGGTEDHDLLLRLWSSGRKGVYLPKIWFHHKVSADRCTRAYHRRWHIDHGAQFALMRDPAFEHSSARLFDIPAHVFREIPSRLWRMLAMSVAGKRDRAFEEEVMIRFLLGFARQRCRDFRTSSTSSIFEEIASAARFLLTRNRKWCLLPSFAFFINHP